MKKLNIKKIERREPNLGSNCPRYILENSRIMVFLIFVVLICIIDNSVYGQVNNFVAYDTTLNRYSYCLESDLVYVNRRRVPIGGTIDLNNSMYWSSEDENNFRKWVCAAFTEERYNFLAQNKADLTIYIYTNGKGYIEGLSFFSANLPEKLTFQDFTNIINQLKGKKVTIPLYYHNWSYWSDSYNFSFKETLHLQSFKSN